MGGYKKGIKCSAHWQLHFNSSWDPTVVDARAMEANLINEGGIQGLGGSLKRLPEHKHFGVLVVAFSGKFDGIA